MHRSTLLAVGAILALPCAADAAVVLSIDGLAPASDVIISNAGNASFLRLEPESSTVAKEGKGQTFTMPDAGPTSTGWGVSRLTLQKNGTQTFGAGSKISLWVFEFSPSNDAHASSPWSSGDGMGDGDPLDGTGITNVLVGKTDIALTGQIVDGQFLHLAFSEPLQMDEGKAYGGYFEYAGTITAPTSGSNPSTTRLQLSSPSNSASSYADGQFLLTATNTNSTASSQDFTFYVTGTPVPEPAGMAAVLGGGLLLTRRRQRRRAR